MSGNHTEKKLALARFKWLEDGTCFGEIPGLRGIWANAKTLQQCRRELREVLEESISLKVRNKEAIPS